MRTLKTAAVLTSIIVLISTAACQSKKKDTAPDGESIRLTNYMTEKERSSISVGELTLLKDGSNAETSESDTHIVEIEFWTNEDYLEWTEANKDMYTEEQYQDAIDFYNSNEFTSIKGAVIDGRYYTGFMPAYEYDGGALSYYVDVSTSVDGELVSTEPQEYRFSSFEEFKPWYRNYVDEDAENGYISQKEADQRYEDMLIIFQSVMDDAYLILDEPAKNYIAEPDYKDSWEFVQDEVKEIKDSVCEISMYDEELDTTFIVHVTLPPDFDESETYPMFVMTDGVWRFGDHPALYNMMENGEAEEVILVSIGYDFSLDGTDDAVRAKYFCEEKELFLDFITDNLTPYLNELYSIDFACSALYGHSLGGVFAHYAAFNSDGYENQPFQYYIIGSPAFWSPYFLPTEEDPDAYKSEYDYFIRNRMLGKALYICGGENEDPDYAEYYGENDTTLEGISKLMKRLEGYGVTSAECEIYEDSNHYEYIPTMFKEFFIEYYGK